MTQREDSNDGRKIFGNGQSIPYIVGPEKEGSMASAGLVIDDLEAFGRMVVRLAAMHEMDAELPTMELVGRILTLYGVAFTAGLLSRPGRAVALSQLSRPPSNTPGFGEGREDFLQRQRVAGQHRAGSGERHV